MAGSFLVSSSGSRSIPAVIVEYPYGATGDVAPARVLAGPGSGIVTASGLALDGRGFLYVASPVTRSVFVLPADAAGSVVPHAVLAGSEAGLTNPQGVVVAGGLLYVANGPFGPGAPGVPSVAVFQLPLDPGNDDVAPLAVIAGPAAGLESPFGLAVDDSGRVYAANLNDTVTVHGPPDASSYAAPDDRAPLLTVTAGVHGPEGLAIAGDTLYVSNDNNTVTTYSLPSGTPGPVLRGPRTRLDQPLGLDVDATGHLLVVNSADQVLVFLPGAAGDTPPSAVIAGPATRLVTPQFVVSTDRLVTTSVGPPDVATAKL